MKIEKVNDHQIRCTLTKADLADRELKISELAYGSEKAKNLFRDMMQQASLKFGFEAEDIPLMIEAIPLNSDCIVLIITKVEDPEELDTRFSRFSPSSQEEDSDGLEELLQNLPGAENVLDLFKRIQAGAPNGSAGGRTAAGVPSAAKEEVAVQSAPLSRIFSFPALRDVIRAASVINGYFTGASSLYKDTASHRYLLVVTSSQGGPREFNKICNILSEYGQMETSFGSNEAYLEEHMKAIVKEHALRSFAQVS